MLDTLKATGVMDPYIGRRLHDLIAPLGLDRVCCEGVTWIHHGGDVAARLIQATLPLHEGAAWYAAADAEEARRALGDSAFTFVDSTWFGAVGRRPP